jgi:20S proteasome alpha/beta subunit
MVRLDPFVRARLTVAPQTLTVLTNETHALISMNMTGTSMPKAGYAAIGFGSSMANACASSLLDSACLTRRVGT